MTIKAITLENFKGISEAQTIELKPVTLLFGPNSAGKSTILQAFIYLDEILTNGNLNSGTTKKGGNAIDLGGFESLVNEHNKDKKIRLKVDLDINDIDLFENYITDKFNLKDDDLRFQALEKISSNINEISIEFLIAWRDAKHDNVRSESAAYISNINIDVNQLPILEIQAGDPKEMSVVINRFEFLHPIFDLEEDLFPEPKIRGEYPFPKSINLNEYHRVIQQGFKSDLDCSFLDKKYVFDTDQKITTEEVFYYDSGEISESNDFLLTKSGGLFKEYEKTVPLEKVEEEVKKHHSRIENADTEGEKKQGEHSYMSSILVDRNSLIIKKGDHIKPDYQDVKGFYHQAVRLENTEEDPGIDPIFGFTNFFRILTLLVSAPIDVLRNEVDAYIYVGPLRFIPDRDFVAGKNKHLLNWADGSAAWEELCHQGILGKVNLWLSSEEYFNTAYKFAIKSYSEIDSKTLSTLRKLGEDYHDKFFDALDESQPLNRPILFNEFNEIELSPKSVGVGLSQILPIIVASISNYQGKNKYVAIEQPELHIHPGMQTTLGDLFLTEATRLNKDADEEESQKYFLVETHSEHLLLRILKRLQQTYDDTLPNRIPKTTSDRIAIYFVKSIVGHTTFIPIGLSESGEFLDDWPDGFFDERVDELFYDDEGE